MESVSIIGIYQTKDGGLGMASVNIIHEDGLQFDTVEKTVEDIKRVMLEEISKEEGAPIGIFRVLFGTGDMAEMFFSRFKDFKTVLKIGYETESTKTIRIGP